MNRQLRLKFCAAVNQLNDGSKLVVNHFHYLRNETRSVIVVVEENQQLPSIIVNFEVGGLFALTYF